MMYWTATTSPSFITQPCTIDVEITDKHKHSPPPKLGYVQFSDAVIVFDCIKTGRILNFIMKDVYKHCTLEQFFIKTLLETGITDKQMLKLFTDKGLTMQW